MAGLFSNMVSVEDEIGHCRQREADERRLAAGAQDASARDAHLNLAERYADRARSLFDRSGNRAVTDFPPVDPSA